MSLQTILAAGFLFLGGIPFLAFPFFIRDMYWLILIGLLLLFLGGNPPFRLPVAGTRPALPQTKP